MKSLNHYSLVIMGVLLSFGIAVGGYFIGQLLYNAKENTGLTEAVQVIFEKEQVFPIATSMMGNVLITKQTGENGKTVNRIFIEEGCDIEREFYLSLLIDRNNSKVMLMISAAGGMDIEDVALTNPEKIINIHFTKNKDISLDENLQKKLKISIDQFNELNLIIKTYQKGETHAI